MKYFFKRLFQFIIGMAFIFCAIFLILSIVFYNESDPSFNVVSNNRVVLNKMGIAGAYVGDFAIKFFGLVSFLIASLFIKFGLNFIKNKFSRYNIYLKIINFLIFIITACSINDKILKNFTFTDARISGSCIGFFINLLGKNINGYAFYSFICVFLILSTSILLDLSLRIWLILFIKIKNLMLFILKSPYLLIKKLLPKRNMVQKFEEDNNYKKLIEEQNAKINELQKYIYSQNKNTEESKDIEFEKEKVSKTTTDENKEKSKSFSFNPFKVGTNKYSLPPLNLLDNHKVNDMTVLSKNDLLRQANDLKRVLADFKVNGKVVSVKAGPIITLYEFEPSAGIKSSRIVGLADDIARNMSVKSTRISTIENKTTLGIEIPNAKRDIISLKEIIETSEYKKSNYNLPIILGKNISGGPVIIDLAKAPHLLIAGTTGSGKSVSINTMILSLLYKFTPDECKFIMIDPKRLELSVYEGIPHLLTPVVTEPQKAVVSLRWVVAEMEDRYNLMSNVGVRNIFGYNEKLEKAQKEGKPLITKVITGYDEFGEPEYESKEIETKAMPYIVVVIDEMADLMITAGKDIEVLIQRIAQMARAAGIHIIMATQRPSVDIITGSIKANFPSRISFLVSSKTDSKVILGEQGAEQLLGMGDMLYSQNGSSITRAHGPFVSDAEIERVISYILSEGFKPSYVKNMYEEKQDDNIEIVNGNSEFGEGRGDIDEKLYKEAVEIVRRDKKTSISYLQRVLRIGYNKSATLIEKMEKDGILTPPNSTGKRELIE